VAGWQTTPPPDEGLGSAGESRPGELGLGYCLREKTKSESCDRLAGGRAGNSRESQGVKAQAITTVPLVRRPDVAEGRPQT
jgi:hypothetical protein